MKRIAICTPAIFDNDAVSNDVFGMLDILRNNDFDVRIFAEIILVSNNMVENIDRIDSFIKKNDDLLIYHLSTGWFKGLDKLSNLNCIKIVKYHNITPPYFFNGFSRDYVETCKGGREQLKTIANLNLDMYLNDSAFNMREMASEGAEASRCFVSPPFNNIDKIKKIEPDLDILDKYNDGKTNILSIGRIAPNKGFERLVEAFAFYHNNYNTESRLIIVGEMHPLLLSYVKYLKNKINLLNLGDCVILPGKVGNKELKSYFLISKIFALTSYHEGFCVPLVEAMSMKIPVVAYGSTAVVDTVGNGGVVWENINKFLFAATFDEIVNSEESYFYLGEAGYRRYKNNFDNKKIEANFLNLIGKYLWKK
jgi:glycosyltransferase involved in cell wall biosynthesis